MTSSIGIDLGGSSLKAVAVTAAGETLVTANVPFRDEKMGWAHKARDLIAEFTLKLGAPSEHIGVSAPGLAAADARSIAVMPGRLRGLEGLDWTEFLGAPRPVPVMNDAHAALLGEVWLGAARGLRNVILLTLGTGVGGAAMVDGHLLRGAIGRAGHLGHIGVDLNGSLDNFNTPGSLEHFMGNKTIAERTQGRFSSTHELVAAHLKNDAAASQVWEQSVRALACAIASFVNILDPEAVIVGGGIARAGAALFEPLQRDLDRFEWRPAGHAVRLLPAQLGELAGAYGSASSALGMA